MCEYAFSQNPSPPSIYSVDFAEDIQTHFLLSVYEQKTWRPVTSLPNNIKECVAQLITVEPALCGATFIVGLGGEVGTRLFDDFVSHSEMAEANFICFLPFRFEGKKRIDVAQRSVDRAKKMGANLSLYPNQELFEGAHPKESFAEAFKRQAAIIVSNMPK